MGEILKNKKVVIMIVSLILAGLSAVVGFGVKDELCGPKVESVAPVK